MDSQFKEIRVSDLRFWSLLFFRCELLGPIEDYPTAKRSGRPSAHISFTSIVPESGEH